MVQIQRNDLSGIFQSAYTLRRQLLGLSLNVFKLVMPPSCDRGHHEKAISHFAEPRPSSRTISVAFRHHQTDDPSKIPPLGLYVQLLVHHG